MGCVGNLSTLFSLVPFHIEMHVQLHLIQWHHKGKYNTVIMFVLHFSKLFLSEPTETVIGPYSASRDPYRRYLRYLQLLYVLQ